MVGASVLEVSGQGNGSRSILSQKRQRDGSSRANTEDKRLSETMLDLNTLDCPICFDALTIPIFQCDNGHLACSSCCPKLNNKCPACTLPIGHIRCRGLECVLGSIIVQCPNAKFGCAKRFSYGEESIHESECSFSLCSCPVQDCNHTASYKDLFDHFVTEHIIHCLYSYICGSSLSVAMHISHKIFTIREWKMRILFVLQCFREPYGVYVTLSCLAPSAPEVGEFSYRLSYTVDGHTMIYESPEVKRVLQATVQTPKKNFLLIPNSLLCGDVLDLKVCIKKLNKE